ncbi:MAG: hypothetical protein GXO02_04700 [Epsilonproteobacteria bacterium]|nr:hypothetical protein [Campylobacterota bacterium]
MIKRRAILKGGIVGAISLFGWGCSKIPLIGPIIYTSKTSIPIKVLNKALKKALPRSIKFEDKEVIIVGAYIKDQLVHQRLLIIVRLIFKSFEIPEGVGAEGSFEGYLRYDPRSRLFFLTSLRAKSLDILDPLLLDYITPETYRKIPNVVKKELETIPLVKMREGFDLRKILSMQIENGHLIIEYERG